MHPLVDTEWLARESGPGLRVVDVRRYLDPARGGRVARRAGLGAARVKPALASAAGDQPG